jgi:TRAP-type C4-dicarboxylate transport system permease small subunit
MMHKGVEHMSDSTEKSLQSRVGQALGVLERWSIVLLVVFLLGFALLQVVLRNVFSTGIVWADTLTRHIVLWIGFLGACLAAKEKKHISIDLLPMIFPTKVSLAIGLLISIFNCVVCVTLLYASYDFVQVERAGGSIAFAGIPLWLFESIFPIAFAIMAFRFGRELVGNALKLVWSRKR